MAQDHVSLDSSRLLCDSILSPEPWENKKAGTFARCTTLILPEISQYVPGAVATQNRFDMLFLYDICKSLQKEILLISFAVPGTHNASSIVAVNYIRTLTHSSFVSSVENAVNELDCFSPARAMHIIRSTLERPRQSTTPHTLIKSQSSSHHNQGS